MEKFDYLWWKFLYSLLIWIVDEILTSPRSVCLWIFGDISLLSLIGLKNYFWCWLSHASDPEKWIIFHFSNSLHHGDEAWLFSQYNLSRGGDQATAAEINSKENLSRSTEAWWCILDWFDCRELSSLRMITYCHTFLKVDSDSSWIHRQIIINQTLPCLHNKRKQRGCLARTLATNHR
jgi:hypothetical protein